MFLEYAGTTIVVDVMCQSIHDVPESLSQDRVRHTPLQ